jgi:hypothetical protein
MDRLETAENKMILLYILNRWSGVTLGQLTRIALDTRYMDYFVFIALLDELCRDGLANRSVRKAEPLKDADGQPVVRCDLTPRGAEVLQTLEGRIPRHVRAYLAQAAASWEKELKRENTVVATYDPDGSGGYQVRLRLNDGMHDVVDLRLSVPDKGLAAAVCHQWKQDTQAVYVGLLALLNGPVMNGPVTQKEEP